MKILKNILTFLLVASLAGFFAMSSFSFSENQKILFSTEEIPKIHSSLARIIKDQDGVSSIEKKKYEKNDVVALEKSQV